MTILEAEKLIEKRETKDLYFYSTMCEHCKLQESDVRGMDFEFIDGDRNRLLMEAFSISQYPALIRIKEGGYYIYVGMNNINKELKR